MRKTIAFVLALILVALMLCSCSTNKGTMDVDGHGKRFQVIERHPSFTEPYTILVDMETGVEYVCFFNSGSVLVDSYGNPILYPAFDAREDKP